MIFRDFPDFTIQLLSTISGSKTHAQTCFNDFLCIFGEYGKLSSQTNSIFCWPSFLRIFEFFFYLITISNMSWHPQVWAWCNGHAAQHKPTKDVDLSQEPRLTQCPLPGVFTNPAFRGQKKIRKNPGKSGKNPENSGKIRTTLLAPGSAMGMVPARQFQGK